MCTVPGLSMPRLSMKTRLNNIQCRVRAKSDRTVLWRFSEKNYCPLTESNQRTCHAYSFTSTVDHCTTISYHITTLNNI